MTDLASLKVPELKSRLEAWGLDTSGKKADLIARLEAGAAAAQPVAAAAGGGTLMDVDPTKLK
eukprot:1577917-Prymnesium_polylepis.1